MRSTTLGAAAAAIACWTAATHAQPAAVAAPPSSEAIVQALIPRQGVQTRSLKGIQIVPEQVAPRPSIDLSINFAYDSTKLDNDSLLTLKRLGTALGDARLAGYRFRVDGYTDAKGGEIYNKRLSEARATAVRDHLVFFYNVAPERIVAAGHGKSGLLDPDHPDDAVNRRVQIVNEGTTSAE